MEFGFRNLDIDDGLSDDEETVWGEEESEDF